MREEHSLKEWRENSRRKILGQIIDGPVHELNNPLTILYGHIYKFALLTKNGPAPSQEKLQEILSGLDESARRIKAVVNKLLAFTRSDLETGPKVCELGDILDQVTDLCRKKFERHKVGLIIKRDSTVLPIQGVSSQLTEIILHLVLHSFEMVKAQSEKWVEIELRTTPHELQMILRDSGKGVAVDRFVMTFPLVR